MADAATSNAIFGSLMTAMFLTMIFTAEDLRIRSQWKVSPVWFGAALFIGAAANVAGVVHLEAPLPMWANVLGLVGSGFGMAAGLLMVAAAVLDKKRKG